MERTLLKYYLGLFFLLCSSVVTLGQLRMDLQGYQEGGKEHSLIVSYTTTEQNPNLTVVSHSPYDGDTIPVQRVYLQNAGKTGNNQQIEIFLLIGDNPTTRELRGEYRVESHHFTALITITMTKNNWYIDPGVISGPTWSDHGDNDFTLTGTEAVATAGGIRYQWEKNEHTEGQGWHWVEMPGETGKDFTPTVSVYETTSYRRKASNSYNTLYSNTWTVEVPDRELDGGFLFWDQVISENTVPAEIEISGEFGSTMKFTYQWEEKPASSSVWTAIEGAAGTRYQPGPLKETTHYRVRVGTKTQTAYSRVCTVTVTEDPILVPGTIDPASQRVANKGAVATLTLKGVGGGNGIYAYQWEEKIGELDWQEIAGATGTTYSPPPTNWHRSYRVSVRSNVQSAYSAPAEVIVIDPSEDPLVAGTIATPRYGYANYVPEEVVVTGTTGGIYSFAFQWQYSYDGQNWSDIAGATESAFFPGALDRTTYFRARVTSGSQSAATKEVQMRHSFEAYESGSLYTDRDRNYIVKYQHLSEYGSKAVESSLAEITYFDGLGRPQQHQAVTQSPQYYNLVTPFRYDDMGRTVNSFLPFPAVSDGGDHGYFYEDQINRQSAYFKNFYPGEPYAGTAYSEKEYEKSPLGRVSREWGAGGKGREAGAPALVHEYGTNGASEVWRAHVTSTASQSSFEVTGYYEPGTLIRYGSTDPDGRRTLRYTDRSGRLVMEQTAESRTYYLYDEYGRLSFVILPEGSKTFYAGLKVTGSDTMMQEHCYLYKYDEKGRVWEKKMPGAHQVYYIYNENNQVVMSQDGWERDRNRWKLYKYDELGRLQTLWWIVNEESLDVLRATYEIKYTQVGDHRLLLQYSYEYKPQTHSDDHAEYFGEHDLDNANRSPRSPRHLKNWERVAILNGDQIAVGYFYRRYYYDDLNRLIAMSEVLDGTSPSAKTPDFNRLVCYEYNFTGDVTREKETWQAPANYTVEKNYTYDAHRRLTSKEVALYRGIGEYPTRINSTTVRYSYDAFGRLAGRSYDDYGLTERMDYDISSLQTSYRSPNLSFRLYYENSPSGSRQYGGGISEAWWRHRGGPERIYSYNYDKNNRLTDARIIQKDTDGSWLRTEKYREQLTYDLNGNITSLHRQDGSENETDRITYSYVGNRIDRLSGTLEGTFHYDKNASLWKDLGNDLLFEYNFLNLVSAVRKNSDGTLLMSVVYGADGTKIALRPHGYGERSESLTYSGGMVFAYGASGYTLEGYRFGEGILTETDIRYHEKDHLGNVRVVTNRKGEVLEQNDYYPYGMRHPDSGHAYDAGNRYRYNGKELLGLAGLYLYDFGARLYDPRTGRWYVRDPLSEKYYGLSPYNYVMGNPVNFIDPDGRIILFAENVSQAFIDKFNGWIDYLAAHGADDQYRQLQESSKVYYINEAQLVDGMPHNRFTPSQQTVYVNLDYVAITHKGYWMSPAAIIDHELHHAVSFDNDPDHQQDLLDIKVVDYGNMEEFNAIQRETSTVVKTGEVIPGVEPRTKHSGGIVKFQNVNGLEIDNVMEIIQYQNALTEAGEEETARNFYKIQNRRNQYAPKNAEFQYIRRPD